MAIMRRSSSRFVPRYDYSLPQRVSSLNRPRGSVTLAPVEGRAQEAVGKRDGSEPKDC